VSSGPSRPLQSCTFWASPAPDMGAVIWKRTQLASGKVVYCDVKLERVEAAIAADVAFLEAHPTRRTPAGNP
jgi:hypothetical protein